MDLFQGFGRMLIIIGLVLAGLGVLMLVVGKIPGIGRLPGDIVFKRGNVTVYFPIVTMVLLSVILTVILNLFFRR